VAGHPLACGDIELGDVVFPRRRSERLSSDAVAVLVARHAHAATEP
jgi:hypothetical protein